jgi:hypothetical protein
MSSKSVTMDATNKIILTNSSTWEDWSERCLGQANMYRLLDHIQGKEELFTKPLKPSMTDYPQKTRPTMATRSQSQPMQAVEGISEEGETPIVVGFSDLTPDGQKSYQMAWSFYQDDLKTFEKQQDLVAKMKEWMITNISIHFQKTCCKAAQSLPEWYGNLKKSAGISRRLEDANARQRYRDALTPPKPKDLAAWADSWEQAMTEAKEKKVVATTRVSEWFEDFLTAVKNVDPLWAKAYGINKDPQVDDETLDFHMVANDLRKVAIQSCHAKIATAKIVKGAFGPTFAGEECQHGRSEKGPEDADEDNSTGKKGGKSRPGKGKQGNEVLSDASRKRKATIGEEARKVCRACEGIGHWTHRCFYLFPDKVPEGWTPREHLQKLVENNLKEDATLKEEVKRWTKKKESDGKNE